jgi:branched-chain amino acid aminotransferase
MPPVKYVSMDGKIVPYDQGTVHVMSPAFRYGAVVFEGIRFYWSESRKDLLLFRLREHLERMLFSMKIMRFDHELTVAQMQAGVLEVIRVNELRETGHIRLFAYVDGEGEQSSQSPIRWAITAIPMPRRARVDSGVRCGISSWQRINDNAMPPRAKVAANYNNGRMAMVQGKLDGFDNVILLTQHGHISESPGSCFFMIRNGTPVTPAVTDSILESITRETIIQLFAEGFGKKVVERSIDRTEVYCAEEAFFCGSGQEVVPILSVDHHSVGTGAVGETTRKLQKIYFDMVSGASNPHPEWITSVYGN